MAKSSRPISGRTFLRLFGVSGGDAGAEPAETDPQGSAAAPPSHARVARRELADRIVDFLIDNDLEITSANLARAHAAFARTDLGLLRKITERQVGGGTIDQAWLDEAAPDLPGGGRGEAEPDTLLDRVEALVAAFGKATSNALTAASAYGTELRLHSRSIETLSSTDQVIASLAELTKAMLDRTRKVEEEMQRSEREASALRKSLEKARQEAEIDHLTGLPNRRAFEGQLNQRYREAQQQVEPLCVAFCDIDHFKSVNDVHGHETGDRVIQAISQVLARLSNDQVHVARHGGEEFVMLFLGRTKGEVKAILDEAREAMSRRNFINRVTGEPIGAITFSAGVADAFAFPDPRDALRAADAALYRAKEAGRNRIEVA